MTRVAASPALRFGADEQLSARIVDGARMKSISARHRRSRLKTQAVAGLIRNRVFRADTLYLRVENTVGARSAQRLSRQVKMFETRD
ncbi:MAG: hypothetical protein WC830_00240 [Burkholderiales bacterium]